MLNTVVCLVELATNLHKDFTIDNGEGPCYAPLLVEKAPNSTFTFSTLLRYHASKRALTNDQ